MSGNGGMPPNKSPGKGGKSLEMMQRRLMAHSQQGQAPPQQPSVASAPTPAAVPAPAPQAGARPTGPPGGMHRPKGKDFASMSARVGVRASPQPMQPTPAPPPAAQAAPVQQAVHRPKGKDFSAMAPKGKDFSAMASRLNHPPQQQQQQQPPSQMQQPPPQQQQAPPHQHQALPHQQLQTPLQQQQQPSPQKQHQLPAVQQQLKSLPQHQQQSSAAAKRAAQLQAEARAAAGLGPLDRPTATAVTITPAPIPAPRISNRGPPGSSPVSGSQQHLSHQQYPSGASGIPQQQQQLHQQQQNRSSHTQPSASVPPGPSYSHPDPTRRTSGVSGGIRTAHHAALAANQQHQPMQPTPHQLPAQMSQQPHIQAPQSQAGGRRASRTGGPTTTATTTQMPVVPSPMPPKSRSTSKPTTKPTATEGRLSLQSKQGLVPVPHNEPLVGERIQDLLKSIDPAYTLDIKAEEQVLELADDFLEKICRQSIRVAMHRGSKTVDVQDVQLMLQTQWGIVVPGLGPPAPKKQPKVTASAAPRTTAVTGLSTNKRKNTSTSVGGAAFAPGSGGPPNKKTKVAGEVTSAK